MNRIKTLKELIATRFDGSQAEFARAIKRSPAQVGQWLGGHRRLGDAGARNIELTLGLQAGFFDHPDTIAMEPTSEYRNVVAMRKTKRDAVTDEINKLLASLSHAERVQARDVLTAMFPAYQSRTPKPNRAK